MQADTELDVLVQVAVTGFSGRVSLHAKNLDTGAEYGRGADTRVQTASTIKVPILVEVHAQVAEGRAHWDDVLTLTEADKQKGAGVLFEMDAGLRLTLRDAAALMIVLSDNTATNLILDKVTTDAVNARLDTLGLGEIRSLKKIGGGGASRAAADPANKDFGIGVAKPRAMTALLEKLAQGAVVSPEASQDILALMKRQQEHLGLGRHLQGAEIASKPGALDLLRSEIGVRYTPRGRIALAITCDHLPAPLWTVDNPAQLLLARLSDLLCDGLVGTPA